MFKPTTIVTTAAVLVSGGALAIAGVSLAGAGEQTQSTAVTAVSRSTPGGGSGYGPGSGCGMGPGGGGMHEYTAVTGDELAKVTDAVKAKDSGVSLTWVGKDQDGDYRGPGTKDGSRVMVEVSKDLATVEVRTGGSRMGGPGGMRGGHEHTAVTGDELAKVTAAVKAKDSAVSVTSVQKDPDGSYDVRGTKSGSPVMVEVSKDLATVEVRTGGMGRMGAPGDQGDGPRQGGYGQTAPGSGSSSSSGAASATSTSFDV